MSEKRKQADEQGSQVPHLDEQTRTYVPMPSGDPIPLEEVSGSGILPPQPANSSAGDGGDDDEET